MTSAIDPKSRHILFVRERALCVPLSFHSSHLVVSVVSRPTMRLLSLTFVACLTLVVSLVCIAVDGFSTTSPSLHSFRNDEQTHTAFPMLRAQVCLVLTRIEAMLGLFYATAYLLHVWMGSHVKQATWCCSYIPCSWLYCYSFAWHRDFRWMHANAKTHPDL